MKKLLAAVLMFSFCTTDAGIIQKMKNVKTKVSTKLGLTKLGSKKQPDQIDNWLTNVQDIVSKIIGSSSGADCNSGHFNTAFKVSTS